MPSSATFTSLFFFLRSLFLFYLFHLLDAVNPPPKKKKKKARNKQRILRFIHLTVIFLLFFFFLLSMSTDKHASVNFYPSNTAVLGKSSPTASKPSAPSSSRSAPILPASILMQLQGRRVTVLLSCRTVSYGEAEEVEGVLIKADEDRGDLFLEEAVHYVWSHQSEETKDTPERGQASASSSPSGGADKLEGFAACSGGGSRRQLRRSKAMMLNSKYIDLISPSLFPPLPPKKEGELKEETASKAAA